MTKEEFITKYLERQVGLLLGAFGQVERTSHKAPADEWASDARFMMGQMRRAKAMLETMYDDLHPTPPKKGA